MIDLTTPVSKASDTSSERGVIWENDPDAATLTPYIWGTPADAARLNADAPVPEGEPPRYVWKPHLSTEQRGLI